MGVVMFGSGADLLTGIALHTGIDAWNAQKLNFGPQIGFNWSPNAKVVWRGGYGLNYNQQQIATANAYNGNPPGTSSVPGTSQSPTQINPNIFYAVSSDAKNINGFPPNPTQLSRSTQLACQRRAARTSAHYPRICLLNMFSTIPSKRT